MTHQELIHNLDVKYTKDPIPCPNEGIVVKLPQSGASSSIHGNLSVHKSGAYLVCGWCGETMPTSTIQ